MLSSEQKKIELSLTDTQGEILVIPNFTLYGEAKKGNKINFSKSAKFAEAQEIYNFLLQRMQKNFPQIKTGEFGAMMEIESKNIGPINYIRDF
ncbi:MAG: D-aminoacyl-tRNA deacylase [bacterium]|nr:D-aminoacyl-tRNA deacylase [bacterium]